MSFITPQQLHPLTRRLNVLRLNKMTGEYDVARHFVPPFWTRWPERYPTFVASCSQIVALPGSDDVIVHLTRATNGGAVSAAAMCTDALARVDPCGCVKWWYHYGTRHTNGITFSQGGVPLIGGIVCDLNQETTVATTGVRYGPPNFWRYRSLDRITAGGVLEVTGGSDLSSGSPGNPTLQEFAPMFRVPGSNEIIAGTVMQVTYGSPKRMARLTADAIVWSRPDILSVLTGDTDTYTRLCMTEAGTFVCCGGFFVSIIGDVLTYSFGLTQRTTDYVTPVIHSGGDWTGPDPAIVAHTPIINFPAIGPFVDCWRATAATSTGEAIYAITIDAPAGFNSAYCLTKFDLDFNVEWQRTVASVSTSHLASDATGVYIAGPMTTATPYAVDLYSPDATNGIAKFTPAGDLVWFQKYSGVPTAINSLAVGNDGRSLWVGGDDYGI